MRPHPEVPRVDHWPQALRSAATLTGTLVKCGPGLRPVAWPETPAARCAAIGGQLSDRYAAIEDTAAWVWGARRSPGSPLRLATLGGRAPASFERRASEDVLVSTFRLLPEDLVAIAAFAVTSRARTAFDLLRAPTQFGAARRVACRLLFVAEPGSSSEVRRRAQGASRTDRARIQRRLSELHGAAPLPA